MAGEGSSTYALNGGDGGHMDLLGGASMGGSLVNKGGNVNLEGGAARVGKASGSHQKCRSQSQCLGWALNALSAWIMIPLP